ncbi:MAG: hypothetical protein KGR17_04810 [Acidobacteria bacterium]|nr:hypothetical protein [Acidobacteriota bacterium]
MAADDARSLTDALAAVHDELWDPAVRLDRMAPGVTPGVDLSSLGLHSVRESALGAYADLRVGDVERALATLRAVLRHQYDAPGRPWDGTFRVTAEQADPPDDEAVEWLHYDPNWRQFLGSILLVVLLEHGRLLPPDLVDGIVEAVRRCAVGEPEDRIPEWYTNPNLLHAWVAAHAGRLTADTGLVDGGVRRAARTMERLDLLGDVDEYNSPTYDGVDLIAAALWIVHPPVDDFAEWGRSLLERLCGRLSVLVDPDLGTVCGPYSRAYGLGLDHYVSLLGLWLHVAGVAGVVPSAVDTGTDHVHDLYFLPLIDRLASAVAPPWMLRPVRDERRHVQAFGGAVATSVLRPGLSVGWADGPVPSFAADQYLPFVVHARTADGVAHLGLRPGGGISGLQVVDQTGRSQQVECVTSGGAGELRLESSEPWSIIDGVGPRSGPFRVETSGEVVVDDRGAAVSFTGGSGELIVRCS